MALLAQVVKVVTGDSVDPVFQDQFFDFCFRIFVALHFYFTFIKRFVVCLTCMIIITHHVILVNTILKKCLTVCDFCVNMCDKGGDKR